MYVLYTMRIGQRMGQIDILPADPYLFMHLPGVNDLEQFRQSRRKIKLGSKLLSSAYERALQQAHVSKQELMLKNTTYNESDKPVLKKLTSRKRHKHVHH